MRIDLTFAALTMLLGATAALAADLNGPARIVDGGTIEIGTTTIRLHGIDGPKPGQVCARGGARYDCAQEAAWALAERIGRNWVRCLERWQDENGRSVASCYMAADIDINAHMVRQGWALARRDENDGYAPLEEAAKRERLGLWAGTFDPWQLPAKQN
jgi:endonuclease YncB( thermonuclease family)